MVAQVTEKEVLAVHMEAVVVDTVLEVMVVLMEGAVELEVIHGGLVLAIGSNLIMPETGVLMEEAEDLLVRFVMEQEAAMVEMEDGKIVTV